MKSIRKGKRAEREFCRIMNQWAGYRAFERNSHGRSQHHADIITPEWFPVKTIEIRWRENWNWVQVLTHKGPVWKWQERVSQTVAHYWLVFTQNRAPWFVFCDGGTYRKLVSVVGDFPVWRSGEVVLFLLADFLATADVESFRYGLRRGLAGA